MIIGNAAVDKRTLYSIWDDPDKVREYSLSLIPEQFRGNLKIAQNQLYYVALHIRKLGLKDFKKMRKVLDELLSSSPITGSATYVVEVKSLYDYVDADKLNLYLERM